MRRSPLSIALALALTALVGCGEQPTPTTVATDSASSTSASDAASTESSANPLAAAWTGPYNGVPAFDQMDVALIGPALEQGMAKNLAELQAIADSSEPPTFANTIEAMERSGWDLRRTLTYYSIYSGNLSSPEFRVVQGEMAPKLADFQTQITQNKPLFKRIEAVRNGEEFKQLRPDQQRLVTLIYDQFARNGATLDDAAMKRYGEINQRLAELHTRFANNVLADEEKYVLYLEESQLGGLPASFVAAAADLAEKKGQPGKYAVLNTRSSMDPFLTYSDERELREQVWRTYYNRGDNGDEHDNNALIAEILALRDERVGLLGYDNYAAWRLEDRMAKEPAQAQALMEAVWPAAIARVAEEVADMQALAKSEGADITIEPWDYRYYAEKVRKQRYDLDSNEVKQYLQLDKLTEAMFYVSGELFDFDFTPVPEGSVPVYHPDVVVWEVKRRSTGDHVGLFYLDAYAREGKRSGAWAFAYRDQHKLAENQSVLASNNSNFIKGKPGEPVLVSWDDATTFFHEFGHALHALSSTVDYPTLNSGVRDYTEFQSQLLERWLSTEPVIQKYLVHVETGEPMPAELMAKIEKAATFNSGFSTTEYLASALIDLKLHMIDPTGLDADAFERETLDALGMPKEIVMRHRTPHFAHVFSGEGYSAGYYGYLWAEVLTADASEAFAKAPGGYYDKDMGKKLVDYLFAVRNALDPAEAYRLFRGADATIAPLLRDRGFPVPDEG
jgi:peptidyl-dipeptidase Dcp